MPRKGTAKVKKVDKYDYLSNSEDEYKFLVTDSTHKDVTQNKIHPAANKVDLDTSDVENVHSTYAREQLKRSNEAQPEEPDHRADQPRQGSITVEQSAALVNSLFPAKDEFPPTHNHSVQAHASATTVSRQQNHPPFDLRPRTYDSSTLRAQSGGEGNAAPDPNLARRAANHNLASTDASHQRQQLRSTPQTNSQTLDDRDLNTMIQGGAFIPANQQRNMRACMVCSIVRTLHQFTTQGCPNCEDILELANNTDQINDCTSQVFEGLISVADTNRSWVARYQRLEGYVPGVYATQVEGILPEDVLVAVENAGINYVPRDGSEQEMLGKD
jgi:transcription elongation factor SPT4